MTSDHTEHRLKQTLVSEDELDLRELFKIIWKGKFWIIGITFIAAVMSVVFALGQPNIYRAEALLVPDEGGGSSGLANLAAQYGGLASMAGISLPSSEADNKAIGIAKIQSRQFIADFIEQHNILPELMAAKAYSPSTGELDYDSEIYDSEAGIWVRDVQPFMKKEPSSQEAYRAMMGSLSVVESIETGFVTVSIDHISPFIAQEWATLLIDDLNKELMMEAVDESQRSIDYLTEQLASTQVVALEQVFYSLIEEQTKTIMLANSRPEYLFKTIDPAIAPEIKFGPNRALICILGTFFGGIFSVLLVLIRHYAF